MEGDELPPHLKNNILGKNSKMALPAYYAYYEEELRRELFNSTISLYSTIINPTSLKRSG